ncbi:pilus assembly protein [Duganella qianjiadongensis]|uniref:Pilus assembly protein PilY n=1 Tax=Duganella qianjiadongensis TaxID=2692176 RepID=A0ABW9VNL1_9BURK|nr:PilC/PilY family type IV pilus protein [Duganella qianjiadongensis]MYM41097.1 pilus assembly protein PilY [Duganella qianjiadongensis]
MNKGENRYRAFWQRTLEARATLLIAGLLICALKSGAAYAAPPVVPLASEPLTTACRARGDSGNSAAADSASRVTGAAGYFPLHERATSAGTWLAASVDLRDWSGYFSRYVLPPEAANAGATITSVAPLWEAGQVLTGERNRPPVPLPEARRIYTAQTEPDGVLRGIPLVWSALSATQQRMLDKPSPSAAAPDGLGARRLAYLRGVRSDEGGPFRRRQSLLGDALRSTPVLVAAPASDLQDAAYAAFRQRYAQRRALVYLGANDGMLHAFDMADGVERYAYVPNALMPYLNLLTDPEYVHRAYVDGPLVSADVRLSRGWRSVLLGAFGAGAQGLFALDVTDPDALDADSVLWEFTDADDPMVGNVLTVAQLARIRLRTGGESAVAVFASGMNNYNADGHASSAGKGALFLLMVEKQRTEGWRLNTNYFRLITPVSDALLANGLSAPALLTDRDGMLRFAYAGDLQGNLWRFDLHGGAPWSGGVERLFTARDAQGRRQPITQQPTIVYGSDGDYLILFGTGRLLNRDDLAAAGFVTQSLYALRDDLARPVSVISGRQQLTQRQLWPNHAGLFDVTGAVMETGSRGWFIDFWQSERTGERSIASTSVIDGTLVFNTMVPGAEICSPAQSRSYTLNALTGLPASSALLAMPATAMVGLLQAEYEERSMLLASARTADRPMPTGAVKVRQGLSKVVIRRDTQGAIKVETIARISTVRRAGRLSWREVSNWRELHEANR